MSVASYAWACFLAALSMYQCPHSKVLDASWKCAWPAILAYIGISGSLISLCTILVVGWITLRHKKESLEQ